MQFESLKVFCDIARVRSFSQAAEANDLTQSAASQIVLQLEKRLGVQLIDRSTRPLQLTEVGQRYYEGCRGLIERYLELEGSIRLAGEERNASVEVAAIYSVGLGDIGQLVERFASEAPRARVHVEYTHPDRVYDKVLEGSVDLGLVSFPRRQRELNVIPWREELMVLACAPKHRFARLRSLRPTQLQAEAYVAFEKGLVIRREVDRFLREQDVEVGSVMEFDNIENIKKAIEVNAGVALLPEPTLKREVELGSLVTVPLAGCRFARPLGIIHRRSHRLGRSAQRFVELLTSADARAGRGSEQANGAGLDRRQRNGTNNRLRKRD
jgi:DNA-binding transcriptional LysR family regulator